jgi:hypothetical protein
MAAVQWQVKLRLGDAVLNSTDTLRAADPRSAAPAGAGDVNRVGVYLTDGVFLYRVVDRVMTARGEMIDVEDCYWLDVVRVPASDLDARRLRDVTPS